MKFIIKGSVLFLSMLPTTVLIEYGVAGMSSLNVWVVLESVILVIVIGTSSCNSMSLIDSGSSSALILVCDHDTVPLNESELIERRGKAGNTI